MLSEFKRCPFCNETVSNDASKCRYCYEWISEKTISVSVKNNSQESKISYSKKQLIAFIVFALTFTSGIFVFGAKAYKLIMADQVVETCSFDDIKTKDGYILRVMDDPDKKESESFVIRDKVNCKYYIKLAGDQKVELTNEFQENILESLENTSEENVENIILPSPEKKRVHLSVDVVTKNNQIQKKINQYIDNLDPQTILTLQVYGGNSENTLSQKKLDINYTPVEIEMYKKTFERQRENVVYIKNKLLIQEKIDLDVIRSNDKEFIKNEVANFYNTFAGDVNYNSNRFLFTYLEYLEDNIEEGVQYKFITDGNFSRIDSRYYNFTEKHYNYHSKRIIERLRLIEEAREMQKESEDDIEIPTSLPQFYTYFNKKFGEGVGGFNDICFDLVQGEKDRNINWMSEKSKLYKNKLCK